MEVVAYGTLNSPVVPGNHYQAAHVHDTAYKNDDSEEESLQANHCNLRYRVRWFYSKGAFLVLIWTVLLNFSTGSLGSVYPALAMDKLMIESYYYLVTLVPYVSWAVAAPCACLLADLSLGTYRVAKIGIMMLFLATIINCVVCQIAGYVLVFDSQLFVGILIVSNMIGFAGQAILLVTLLTLGLNQMPDASSDNVTSFVVWFVCSIEVGLWICDATSYIPVACLEVFTDYVRIWSFFPVLVTGVVLISDSLLAQKWLIIEPRSPQSLHIIYFVLKFAAKHKAPLNHSALSHWEEDIPSRIDLGKSRYGGPFSTEQIEDIKAILRLLAIGVPTFVVILAYYLWMSSPIVPDDRACGPSLIVYTIDGTASSLVFAAFTYEFLIYPLTSCVLPSILKRIGIAAFLTLLLNIVYLLQTIALAVNTELAWPWLSYSHFVAVGLVKMIWLTSTLELVVVHSPYTMREFTIGYFWCLDLLLFLFASIGHTLATVVCVGRYCYLAYGIVAAALSAIGFVFFCMLARWYKRRVRDDITTYHKWADNMYDRYLQS